MFTAARMGTQPATAQSDKTEFDLAATAAVGAVVSPELPDIDDPLVVSPPLAATIAEPERHAATYQDAEPENESDVAR
jgi:hypothetical protein